MNLFLYISGYFAAGVATFFAIAWFTDSLDEADKMRSFEAVAAATITFWPVALAWLMLRTLCVLALLVIAKRGGR